MVDIVSRAAWGANPLVTPARTIRTPAPELWLHHTASRGLHGPGGMRSLQQYAMRNGYADLEYSYVVDMDGKAYMSRGPGRDSAATGGGHNPTSHAICAMGNFELEYPTQSMLVTIAALTRDLHQTGASATATITGPHRAASGNSTACCGKYLIARIGEINRAATGTTPAPEPPKEEAEMQVIAVTNPKAATNEQPFAYLDPTARKVWSCWGFKVAWDGGSGDSPLQGTKDPKSFGVPGTAPLVGWEVLSSANDGQTKRICVYGVQGAEYVGTAHG